MAEPNEYLLVLALQAALRAISVNGGFNFDVADVAVKLDPNQDVEALIPPSGPRPIIILELTPDTWRYFPSSQVVLDFQPVVHWVHDADPTDDLSRLRTFLYGCADIERALERGTPSLGQYATDNRITSRTLDLSADGSLVWASLQLSFRIDRTWGQP